MTIYDEKFKVDNAAEPVFGIQVGPAILNVHRRENCQGRNCCIHNPSDHPLKDAPMNWRSDKGTMERICEHGIGHDDPDDIAYKKMVTPQNLHKYLGIHGCDGCC